MAKKNLTKIPLWVYFISVLLILIGGYYSGLPTVFGGLLGIWFGQICSRWAVKIKRDFIIAYFIGFLLGLLGLGLYYLYYNYHKNKELAHF